MYDALGDAMISVKRLSNLKIRAVEDLMALVVPHHLGQRFTGHDDFENGLASLDNIESTDRFDESWRLHWSS